MESVARYDLIVFMVNMSNRASWDECRHSLRQLDPGWFLGRCALVVTQVAAVSKYAFDRDDITDFIDGYYDVPTMWVNLDVDSEAALAALQLVRILEIGAGYRRRNDSGLLGTLTGSQVGGTLTGPTTTSAASSFWGSYRCSKLGSRLTATHVMMKCPEMYTVPITTLLAVEAEEEEEEVTGDNQ
ncbi:MAG: centromere protein M (CENP-M)-domain-containing protein [Benniella sp.]|nr:MAG: centromere protein M (CENP-M)-domain-containing protein [Benniella sp.]